MAITGGTHFEDFSVNELDSFFRSEESGFSHLDNFVGREKLSGDFHSHSLFSSHDINQFFWRNAIRQLFARWRPFLDLIQMRESATVFGD
jgi:hypothetical protein